MNITTIMRGLAIFYAISTGLNIFYGNGLAAIITFGLAYLVFKENYKYWQWIAGFSLLAVLIKTLTGDIVNLLIWLISALAWIEARHLTRRKNDSISEN